MQTPSHIILRKNLTKLKKVYGLSLSKIAKNVPIKVDHLSKMFKGHRPIGLKQLDNFAKFFSIKSHELLNPSFNVVLAITIEDQSKRILINGKNKTVNKLTKEKK